MTQQAPVYFWRPHEPYGFLGQWYSSPFISKEKDGREFHYENAEQYMMHRKGLLFAPDDEVTAKILTEDDPKEIKALGRSVPNFDEEKWKKERYSIVVQGNYLKFTQNEDLRKQLLATETRDLVEASPLDRIWGIGFGWRKAEKQRQRWGLNLLGKALVEVRERLRNEGYEE